MAVDLAEIGFVAKTDELEKAREELQKLSPAAEKAERSADKLNDELARSDTMFSRVARGSVGLGAGFKRLVPIVAGVAAGFAAAFTGGAIITAMSRTANELDAIGKKARALGETTAGMQSLAVAADMAGSSFEGVASASRRMVITLAQAERTGKGSEGVFKRLGVSAGELLRLPLNERLSLIADRFRDLGLSADETLPILAQLGDRQGALINLFEGGGDQIRMAADMMERFGGTISDLQIAKIEEMNDAFSSIGVALGAFRTQVVAAFAPFLGPVFTIIAEGVGRITSGIKALLDGTSALTPFIYEAGIALGIAFSPVILAAMVSMISYTASLTVAMGVGLVGAINAAAIAMARFALANPFTAIILGISTALAAAYVFRDAISNILGVDIVAAAKNGANAIIAAMVGGYNAIRAVWSALPGAIGDIVIQTANAVIRTVQDMINKVIGLINGFISSAYSALSGLAGMVGLNIGEFGGIGELQMGEIANSFAGQAAAAGQVIQGELQKAFNTDWIGGFAAQISEATTQLSIAEGAATGLAGSIDDIGNAATGGGGAGKAGGGAAEKLTELQKIAEDFAKLSEPFNQAGAAFDAARQALENGIITNDQYADSVLRIEDAFMRAGGSAGQWAKIISDNTDNIASSLKQLAEGALTQLGDEFISLAVDGKANFADLAKSIIKDLLRIAWQALIVKPLLGFLGFSQGGSFGGGGALQAVPFANGGAFTNGVYDRPTMFAFANGGALGVMGEAGAEAVMPLHRGPDGSLGVQMYGGDNASGSGATVNVEFINNVPNTTVRQERGRNSDGQEVVRFILDTVAQGMAAGEFDRVNEARYNNRVQKTTRG